MCIVSDTKSLLWTLGDTVCTYITVFRSLHYCIYIQLPGGHNEF